MPHALQLPKLGNIFSFREWEAAVIALLKSQPKGTALKVGGHSAIMLLLDELIYLEVVNQVHDAGGRDASFWDSTNIPFGMSALNHKELFQRCSVEEFDTYELEILQFFLHRNLGQEPRYEDFARVAKAMLARHPVGTALHVTGELDYLLVGGLLSCIDHQSSIEGICLRDAYSWSSMHADLAALRSPKFYQCFDADEIAAFLREEPSAPPGVDTTHMSARQYELAVMSLLCGHPKGTGLKDQRGAIFIINGELMHVEDGKRLEDATDCDLEAWGDTDPAPDIEALQRAELLQLLTTDEVIAFEQEHCP